MSGILLVAVGFVIIVLLFVVYYFIMTNPERVGEQEEEAAVKESWDELAERLTEEVDPRTREEKLHEELESNQ